MTDNVHTAIISHDNDLIEQVSDLMGRNDTIEGRAAIADCLAVIVRSKRRAIEADFKKSLHEGLGAKQCET